MSTRTRHRLAARLAALLGVVGLSLGASALPAPAAAGTATPPTGLNGVTITNVNNGRGLDVQNGNTGDGVFVVTNSSPGYHQKWRISPDPSDSSFSIVNSDTGKCVDAGTPLRQQSCDGRASEQWYFQPVTGRTDTFMIRQKRDNTCLDVWYAGNYDDAWTDNYSCNGTGAQRWTLSGTGTAAKDAFALAVDYAAARCAKDTSTCSWSTRGQTPAAPLPKQCVSPVWYNGSQDPAGYTFSIHTQTGWSSTLGWQLTASLGSGGASPVAASVASTVSGNVTLSVTEDLGNSVSATIPPNQYGWVALSELATKVTGTWTFDKSGFAWTADDTLTVPLKDDPTAGASIYSVQTSTTFTNCQS
ncbi:RICIN domain-containing protein [Streptomyces sp. NPDC018610]|uniref:RICIN domain-containing protein n=1 Tax=Streptomyces sp. NPDC018610 TaxID=3365049 RepID=UPI0037958BD4